MDALERYLSDCENKRRRMRDRPSDMVVQQMRWLVSYFKKLGRAEEKADPSKDTPDADPDLPVSPSSA